MDLGFSEPAKANVMGRIYLMGETIQIEVWEQDFEPMDLQKRSGAEGLRNLLSIPAEGDFQILFTGTMSSARVYIDYCEEWSEEFNVASSHFKPVPAEYVKVMTEDNCDEAT